MQCSLIGRTSSKVERIDWPAERAERNSDQLSYSSLGIEAARFFARETQQLLSPAMPTFVAMSSRNRCVAVSTNGLLSGIRYSNAISTLPLHSRPAHDHRVD